MPNKVNSAEPCAAVGKSAYAAKSATSTDNALESRLLPANSGRRLVLRLDIKSARSSASSDPFSAAECSPAVVVDNSVVVKSSSAGSKTEHFSTSKIPETDVKAKDLFVHEGNVKNIHVDATRRDWSVVQPQIGVAAQPHDSSARDRGNSERITDDSFSSAIDPVRKQWLFTVSEPSHRTWLPRAVYAPFQPMFRRSVVREIVKDGHTCPMIDVVIPFDALNASNAAIAQRAFWGGAETAETCRPSAENIIDTRKRRFSESSCESLSSTASHVIFAHDHAIGDNVWYTDDSDAAAIVAQRCGPISVASVLRATFEIGPGRESYTGVVSNGIESRTWAHGEAHSGYSVRLVRVSTISSRSKRKSMKPRTSTASACVLARTLRFSATTHGPVHGMGDLAAVLCGPLSEPVALEGPCGERHVLRITDNIPLASERKSAPLSDNAPVYSLEDDHGHVVHANVASDEMSRVCGGLCVRGSLVPAVGYVLQGKDNSI